MALIQTEQDDEAVMKAEDEAIAAANAETVDETPDDIGALIERLASAPTEETPVHEG